jgi:hypothetical protein
VCQLEIFLFFRTRTTSYPQSPAAGGGGGGWWVGFFWVVLVAMASVVLWM